MSEDTQQAPIEESYWATPRWAIVEIKGHRRHVALCSEVDHFGGKMLRCDISENAEGSVTSTSFYPGSSLHALTPITEEYAKKQLSSYYGNRTPALAYGGNAGEDEEEDRPFG